MIILLIFMASLETKVAKADKGVIEKGYKDLKKESKPYQEKAPAPSTWETAKAAVTNTRNIATNAIDNTLGYGVSLYQNYRTRRHFKKQPASKDKIVYLMHGLFQNKGSQWRLAKKLRKEGYQPYHLKGHHHMPSKDNADRAFEQIEDLYRYSKIKKGNKRKDYFSGHSSGANMGIYMAGDSRIKKYGIKAVQARAPAPSGIEAKTISQKVLMPFADVDNVKKNIEARRDAVRIARNKPKVPVYIVAGKYDNLVPPSDTVYRHAKKHYIINHPDSTHFGTSGVNSEMNQIFVDMIGKGYKKHYRKKSA